MEKHRYHLSILINNLYTDQNKKMKFSVAISLIVVGLASVSAFAPSFNNPRASMTKVNAEPEEEDGLDLNLEEMFDM